MSSALLMVVISSSPDVPAGTFTRVDWTMEFPLQDWRVDFAHDSGAFFVFHAHHDAVGVKEIAHCRAFTQELRIGRDLKSDCSVA